LELGDTVLGRWSIGIVHALCNLRSKLWANLRKDIKLAGLDLIRFDLSKMPCDVGNQILLVVLGEFLFVLHRVSVARM
jgi:hypothetical protein